MRSPRAALLLLCVCWACDDGGSAQPPALTDAAMPDATVIDAATGDAIVEDATVEDDAAPDMGPMPPPIAQPAEQVPFAVDQWVIGVVQAEDGVLPQMERGRFFPPDAGAFAYSLGWQALELDVEGRVPDFGRGIAYVGAKITVDAPTRIVAQLDRVLELYVNGVRQPGDVYGNGRMRLPIQLKAGNNAVAMRTYGARGAPVIRLWQTPDEIVFNTADLTAPMPRIGDANTQYVGVAVVNLTAAAATDLRARVVESDVWTATEIRWPGIAPNAVSQIGFELTPKGPIDVERPPEDAEEPARIPVTIELTSADLAFTYQHTIQLDVSFEGAYRRTFRSPTDNSIQFYGVQPPPDPVEGEALGLVLSLHGAGVGGLGQARAYSAKDWSYLIAPTNRRPFGFDWEEWGRLNGLNALADAMTVFPIDETRVHVTGHSMGGHGTWHFGVHDAGRFAVVGPSAGWESFYSYGGAQRAGGPFGRARAHSDTLQYLSNLADKAVYIIHGDADDNVPVSEGRNMRDAVGAVTDDLGYHEQPGAGHWWDGEASPGADCVDWPPLFELMQNRTVDPWTLEFDFVSPSPAYNPTRSYATVASVSTADRDFRLTSARMDDQVVLVTDNVRSLVLDGDRLMGLGVTEVVVDGMAQAVMAGSMYVGPASGKRPDVQGPFNQAFHRPFCFIYPDEAPKMAELAAFMTSQWALIGNGHACSLPASALTDDVAADWNLIHLGRAPEDIGADVAFMPDADGVTLNGDRFEDSALMYVFDAGDRLNASLSAADGFEYLLYRVIPFSSRAGLPDYLVWSDDGGQAAGFFGPDWQLP